MAERNGNGNCSLARSPHQVVGESQASRRWTCASILGDGGPGDWDVDGGSHHWRAESRPADRESSSGNRRLSPSTGPSCRRFAVHRERRSSHSESRRIGKMEADSARRSGQEVTFQRNEGWFVTKQAARRKLETGRTWDWFECHW